MHTRSSASSTSIACRCVGGQTQESYAPLTRRADSTYTIAMTSNASSSRVKVKAKRQLPPRSASVTPESAANTNAATSNDRSHVCAQHTPTLTSSPTLPVDSTSNAKAFLPFWNEYTQAVSKKLWCSTATDCVVTETNCSSGSLQKLGHRSWFTATEETPNPSAPTTSVRANLPTTCCPSSQCLSHAIMAGEQERIVAAANEMQRKQKEADKASQRQAEADKNAGKCMPRIPPAEKKRKRSNATGAKKEKQRGMASSTEDKSLKTIKQRIYFGKDAKESIIKMMGAQRWIYNQGVAVWNAQVKEKHEAWVQQQQEQAARRQLEIQPDATSRKRNRVCFAYAEFGDAHDDEDDRPIKLRVCSAGNISILRANQDEQEDVERKLAAKDATKEKKEAAAAAKLLREQKKLDKATDKARNAELRRERDECKQMEAEELKAMSKGDKKVYLQRRKEERKQLREEQQATRLAEQQAADAAMAANAEDAPQGEEQKEKMYRLKFLRTNVSDKTLFQPGGKFHDKKTAIFDVLQYDMLDESVKAVDNAITSNVAKGNFNVDLKFRSLKRDLQQTLSIPAKHWNGNGKLRKMIFGDVKAVAADDGERPPPPEDLQSASAQRVVRRKRDKNKKKQGGWYSRTERHKEIPRTVDHLVKIVKMRHRNEFYLCICVPRNDAVVERDAPQPIDTERDGTDTSSKKRRQRHRRKLTRDKEIRLHRTRTIAPHDLTACNLPVLSVDQGEVAFFVGYDAVNSKVVSWGRDDVARLMRLLIDVDTLTSMSSNKKKYNHNKRFRLRRKAGRIRRKVKNLRTEMQRKAAIWMCANYPVIILPKYETSDMLRLEKRIRRKKGAETIESIQKRSIGKKTARKMSTWSHYQFRQLVLYYADLYNCAIIEGDEPFTSQTCGLCGTLHKIPREDKRRFKCPSCKCNIDRDGNGARNIVLRFLTLHCSHLFQVPPLAKKTNSPPQPRPRPGGTQGKRRRATTATDESKPSTRRRKRAKKAVVVGKSPPESGGDGATPESVSND